MTELAEYIEKWREELHVSRRRMGTVAGLSASTVDAIVNQGTVPLPGTLEALARAWTKTKEEFWLRYGEMLALAGYSAPLVAPPNEAERNAFIEEIIDMLEGLTEDQKRDIHARIAAYRANNLLGKQSKE